MRYLRVWLHDPLKNQDFFDDFHFKSNVFATEACMTDVLYRLYEREAPRLEVLKVSIYVLIERDF